MPVKSATPYLILNGKAREAISLYERALGARVENLKRFGDMDASCPEARRDNVMHAELRVGSALLMLSDGGPDGTGPAQPGPISVALELDDQQETRRIFDGLANGGKAVQPLFDSPWGTLFGVVQDRFGISWMLDCRK
ncbi:MAG TPA: VOC family protein [Vicinamibacterales bacterium]